MGPALDQTYLSGTPRAQRPAAARQPGIFDINRRIRHNTNGRIRHKRTYSTQTGVFDTGPVTPAMTSHRTRADEWSIPHTGGVPCCRAACSTRLTQARLSAATGCRWPGWWWVRSLGLGSGSRPRRMPTSFSTPCVAPTLRREADVSGSPRHNRCAAAEQPQHVAHFAENHRRGIGLTVITTSGRPSSGPSRRVHRGRGPMAPA